MKKRSVFLFLTTFILFFSMLSLWTHFQEKKTKEFSAVLEQFRSDFFKPSDKDALIDKIIAKKKRFVAYGTYIQVPAGEYVAAFRHMA